MDSNAQFPSWTTHDFLLNVGAVHELKHILCRSSNIVSVAFMLSRNASHTHETVPDGFYFEDIVFLDDLFKTGKKGIQGLKQIPGFSILNHFGESDEVCEENGYCRIILTLDLLAAFIKFFILPDHDSSCISLEHLNHLV